MKKRRRVTEKPPHRFVIIGPGYISRRYVEKITAMQHACVVAVVGRNFEKTRQYAEQCGIPASGTDLRSVVQEVHPTAAIICTPNALHHEGVAAAASLGLHCLCEKPLDISLQNQNAMIATCRRNNVKLAVAYMHRFHNHLRYIKERIDSGVLGRLLVVDAMLKTFREPAYYQQSYWHGTREMDGGGPFIQQGSHILDLVLWLVGAYREVLGAKRFTVFHDIEVEDHGYAVIQFISGAVGMIEASTACRGMAKQSIEIAGTKGHIIADLEKIIDFDVMGEELPQFEPDDDLYSQLLADFIDSIESDREPFVTAESAKGATELILDIYAKAGPPDRML